MLWRPGDDDYLRIAEDSSFATLDDVERELGQQDDIVLAHPATMTDAQLDAWRQVFSEYEVLQPFEQLNRKLHCLEFSAKDTKLPQFTGRNTTGRRLFSARKRG